MGPVEPHVAVIVYKLLAFLFISLPYLRFLFSVDQSVICSETC